MKLYQSVIFAVNCGQTYERNSCVVNAVHTRTFWPFGNLQKRETPDDPAVGLFWPRAVFVEIRIRSSLVDVKTHPLDLTRFQAPM